MDSYTIIDIMYSLPKELVFWSCPNCMCKMSDDSFSLHCKSCREYHHYTSVYRKFKLPLRVANVNTGRICHLTVFGKSLVKIFGCNADSFIKFSEKAPPGYKWHTILQRILIGKTVSVHITKLKDDIFPNIMAHGLRLPHHHYYDNVVNYVTRDLNLTSDSDCLFVLPGSSDLPATAVQKDATAHELCNNDNSNSWHESLLQEFEETFKNVAPNSDRTPLADINILTTPCKDEICNTAEIEGGTALRKRLLPQLDTPISSPASNMPRSKMRFHSPFQNPITSTPRQNIKNSLHTRNIATTVLDENTVLIPNANQVAGMEPYSKCEMSNRSGDLFSEITENLSSVTVSELDDS